MSLAPTKDRVKPLVTFCKSKESTLTYPLWNIYVWVRSERLRIGGLGRAAAGIGWSLQSAALGIPLHNSWAQGERYESFKQAREAAKAYVIESLAKIHGGRP